MKVRASGEVCISITEGNLSSSLSVADEGTDLGEVDTLNFVGANVTVSKSGTVATITISGSGTGSFIINDYTDFETLGLPSSPAQYSLYQLRFSNVDFQQTINGVQFNHNDIIYWTGTKWISWTANRTS